MQLGISLWYSVCSHLGWFIKKTAFYRMYDSRVPTPLLASFADKSNRNIRRCIIYDFRFSSAQFRLSPRFFRLHAIDFPLFADSSRSLSFRQGSVFEDPHYKPLSVCLVYLYGISIRICRMLREFFSTTVFKRDNCGLNLPNLIATIATMNRRTRSKERKCGITRTPFSQLCMTMADCWLSVYTKSRQTSGEERWWQMNGFPTPAKYYNNGETFEWMNL